MAIKKRGFMKFKNISKEFLTVLTRTAILLLLVPLSSWAAETVTGMTTTVTEKTAAATATTDLKNILAPVQSLTADFQQKMTSEKGRILQQSTGKMWLKKPGQFRWEVLGKEARLVVSNGKQVWDYDKDLEQVTIQKLSKGEVRAPIFFLTGEVNSIDRDFNVKNISIAGKSCMQGSDQCFELYPKNEQTPFQWIRVGFKNKILKDLEILDQLGQHSFFSFENTKMNPSVSPGQFSFTPPKGVDVVGG
jgi:outer membrane lipoprotein carrier protein